MSHKIFHRALFGILLPMLALIITSCGEEDGGNAKPLTKKEAGRKESSGKASAAKADIPQGPRHHDRIKVNNLGPLREVFNDSNKYHYEYAERLGIDPIHSLNDAYFAKRPLVYIESCDDYAVDTLTHSMPYLVPEGARLLSRIGRNFIDSLANRGGDGYRIKVTSLLRTPKHVKKLRRVNVNSTDSSTHQFGTTFDISWTNFVYDDPDRTLDEGDLKNLLAEVLYDLRNEGACLVKYEHKTCCFHITAIK